MNLTSHWPKGLWAITFGALGFVLCLAAPIYADAPLPTFTVTWGQYGPDDAEFRSPTGITVDNHGNVYVVDEQNDRLQKFDHNGQFLFKWGKQGSAAGQFLAPTGVAVDTADNVYIADTNNQRIQKFTDAGNYVAEWGAFGTGDGQFKYPRGIAIDNTANVVYVVDQHNHRIQKFSLDGTFLLQWGEYDPLDGQRGDPGQLDLPTGIGLDSNGHVYVTDTFNNRVQKFTATGTFVAEWGTPGSGHGQFDSPTGIAIDSTDNIYIADTNNNRIQKFDASGIYLGQWGTAGSGDGQFLAPGGVAVSGPGEIYVTDVGNHRVQKFGGLWLTKKATVSGPMAGEPLSYLITVANNGPVTATYTLISDTLDSDLQLAGPVQLDPPQPEAIVATSALSLPLIAGNVTLAPSTMLTVTVPVTVNPGLATAQAIANTAAVSSSEFVFVSRDTALVIANPYQHYLPVIFK